MSTASTIQASIDSLDAEIDKLNKARGELVELLGDDEAVEETPRRSRSTKSSGKSSSRRARVTEDEDEDEKPARRSRSGGKRDAERKASSKTSSRKTSSNGAKEGGTRRDQIASMLDDDMSPREIADELGIATNYVYNVRRQLA